MGEVGGGGGGGRKIRRETEDHGKVQKQEKYAWRKGSSGRDESQREEVRAGKARGFRDAHIHKRRDNTTGYYAAHHCL